MKPFTVMYIIAACLLGCSPKTPARILDAELNGIGLKLKWNPLSNVSDLRLISREVSDVHVTFLLEGDRTSSLLTNIISHCGEPKMITYATNGNAKFIMYSESCLGVVFSSGSRMVDGKMLTTVTFNKPE